MDERVLYIKHSIVCLRILVVRGTLREVEFLDKLPRGTKSADATDPVARQFLEYLSGQRASFDLPFTMEGTPFQQRVWEQTALVGYGCTVTYGEIASRIGSPNSARAVGNALHVNPLPLLIPCHRVLGSTGKLTGFAGGLTVKQRLLDLERKAKGCD